MVSGKQDEKLSLREGIVRNRRFVMAILLLFALLCVAVLLSGAYLFLRTFLHSRGDRKIIINDDLSIIYVSANRPMLSSKSGMIECGGVVTHLGVSNTIVIAKGYLYLVNGDKLDKSRIVYWIRNMSEDKLDRNFKCYSKEKGEAVVAKYKFLTLRTVADWESVSRVEYF